MPAYNAMPIQFQSLETDNTIKSLYRWDTECKTEHSRLIVCMHAIIHICLEHWSQRGYLFVDELFVDILPQIYRCY